MPLFLIRHGETALNVARTLQPAATPLSARGLAQAQALAQRLAAMGVTAILSSDLPRALQTAQAIAMATGVAVQTTELLHERNFGDLRGQPYDHLDFNPLTMDGAPPGGESSEAFGHRVEAAFAAALALQRATGGSVVVVTHGLVIRRMLQRCVRIAAGTALPESIANASLTVASDAPPHAVSLLDSTTHLRSATQDNPHNLSGG
jgi:probable phosphoglycerate mutase